MADLFGMFRFLFASLSLVLAALLCTSCAHMFGHNRSQRSSSIVGFLYPGKEETIVQPAMPVLRLPLRVGIAFVPAENNWGNAISEQQRNKLLDRIATKFRDQGFISKIELIPSTYLRPKGSFNNLDQVARMLQIDLVVLVSYDQMQFADDNFLSLSYWTIVGAYLFKGNKNDTQTLIEAAVYDIPSRSFLFRAPGANQLKSSSTGIKTQERQRADSVESLSQATDDLIANLDAELSAFRLRVKEGKANVRVEHREGYSGGGSIGAWFTLGLLGIAFCARRLRRP